MSTTEQIKMRYDLLNSALGEKQRRLYLAVEAKALGRGGVSQVARATGTSRATMTGGPGGPASWTNRPPRAEVPAVEEEATPAHTGGTTSGRGGQTPQKARRRAQADGHP